MPGAPLRSEDGSAAVEVVLAMPLIMLVTALVVFAGRVVEVRLQAETAAHQAARAASLQSSPEAARTAAATLVAALSPRCAEPEVVVDTSGWAPGGQVQVTVTCRPSLADLTLLPVPAVVAVHASFTSPIDAYGTAQP